MVFDNATSARRRVCEKVVESKLFAAFKQHYRTTAKYCNPYSGHEKGNVENAVGFLRRNLMVPIPEAASLTELNQRLLAGCVRIAGSKHWRKEALICDLFKDDVTAGLALPGVGFDPVRYETRRADTTGAITIDGNRYLAGPRYRHMHLTVGIRHDVLEILDETSDRSRDLRTGLWPYPGYAVSCRDAVAYPGPQTRSVAAIPSPETRPETCCETGWITPP